MSRHVLELRSGISTLPSPHRNIRRLAVGGRVRALVVSGDITLHSKILKERMGAFQVVHLSHELGALNCRGFRFRVSSLSRIGAAIAPRSAAGPEFQVGGAGRTARRLCVSRACRRPPNAEAGMPPCLIARQLTIDGILPETGSAAVSPSPRGSSLSGSFDLDNANDFC